ncbi:MAG: hypothetical protein RJA99_3340 [Pseudomonadota bacterium]|jgi:type IV secretion system protein VirB5
MTRPTHRFLPAALIALALALTASPARAGIPVIDVAALAQLMQQVTYWTQQIQHMVTQVNQLKATHDSMTGDRGLQTLLPVAIAARNYLPEEIGPVLDAGAGIGAAYGEASGLVTMLVQANAKLAPDALAELTPDQRAVIEDARRAAAALQGLSRTAYGRTSQRFAQLQQLIAAIGTAGDQKAMLELSARIQSEQTMLQNEQAKLTTLYQAAQAQALVRVQQIRELTVQGAGTFRQLPSRTY